MLVKPCGQKTSFIPPIGTWLIQYKIHLNLYLGLQCPLPYRCSNIIHLCDFGYFLWFWSTQKNLFCIVNHHLVAVSYGNTIPYQGLGESEVMLMNQSKNVDLGEKKFHFAHYKPWDLNLAAETAIFLERSKYILNNQVNKGKRERERKHSLSQISQIDLPFIWISMGKLCVENMR